MVKRYLLAGIGVAFFWMCSVLYGADTELTLEDSTSNSGFSVKDSSGNTIMRVVGDGNVGIGTMSPATKLHVGGGLPASPAGDGIIRVGTSNGAGTGFREWDFGTSRITGLEDNFFIRDLQMLAPSLVIKAGSGNVGIGTTNPIHPLHMGSGAHVTAAGVWTNASSREYKDNIRDLTVNEAMATLAALRPSRFNYKVDKDDEYVGFIAEDVPELVATKDRKGLAPMDITAVLTKVVQEQQRMLQTQNEAILALSAKVNALENKI